MAANISPRTRDASQTAIYRWVKSLCEHEHLINPLTINEDGDRYLIYETTLEYVMNHVIRCEDTVDRCSRIWDDQYGGKR